MKEESDCKITINNVNQYVLGYDRKVPIINGELRQYINFDNAASTPALKPVMEKVNEFMEWYSSIHRGTGFKSQLCSEIYDHSRDIVAKFVNVDPETHAIIFVKNTTEAINKLANRLPVRNDEVIITTRMEHHSNDLPWRQRGKVVFIDVLEDGRLDEEDLIRKLKQYHGKIALVSLTGASNVTGWVNDINRLAALVHEHGAKIMIDAAQLIPHRKIDMRAPSDPGHIDFLAFSAHKIYAPFGAGVLIGDKEFFEQGNPDYVGGGTVSVVSYEEVYWTHPPEKDEAGTPNTVGVMAMAKTLLIMMELGMDRVAEHEKVLTRHMLRRMKEIPNLTIYGSADPEVVDNRLGVISFNIEGVHHALTAAILNFEGAIGVRNGCFCAHPYLKLLLGIGPEEARELEQEMLRGDRSRIPGAVRASFGMYNTTEEIDQFIEVLKKVANGTFQGKYVLDKKRGEYRVENYQPPLQDYFRW